MGPTARDAGMVPPHSGVAADDDGAASGEVAIAGPRTSPAGVPTAFTSDGHPQADGDNHPPTTAAVPSAGPATAAATDTPPSTLTAPGAMDLPTGFDAVVANVRTAYIGREDTVRLALCCLLAEGHLLVEDHPGVGKTTLAKALARSLGLGFGRIQFTADLLPADVTGAVVFERESGRISFRPGPVFTNVLLADELNRASPKAQSALLEAMEERQVSADGVSHLLPEPFMVLATQNPFDAAGTFPLPHSQRDRFLLRLSLGYPDRLAEDELLATTRTRPVPEALAPVGGPAFLRAFTRAIADTFVAPEVRSYVLDLVAETRMHPDLAVGASPRAALCVLRAAASMAVAAGRAYVTPDDVKAVAEPALGHRVVVHPAAELAGVTPPAVIEDILTRIVVPIAGTG